jgi:hypothetical protein
MIGGDIIWRLARVVRPAQAYAFGLPVLGAARDPVATLDQEHALAGIHELVRHHRSTETAPDDDRVEVPLESSRAHKVSSLRCMDGKMGDRRLAAKRTPEEGITGKVRMW